MQASETKIPGKGLYMSRLCEYQPVFRHTRRYNIEQGSKPAMKKAKEAEQRRKKIPVKKKNCI